MNIYALKNTKVGFWNPPTFSPIEKDGVKAGLFRECMLNREQSKKNHLDECELYYLGTFDDIHGKLNVLEDPEFVYDLKEAFRE